MFGAPDIWVFTDGRGSPGETDSESASYGTTFHDGDACHMFYFGTQNVAPSHNIPAVPYVTLNVNGS